MPAHTREIPPTPQCKLCRHRRATCHVFNTWNADLGPCCTRCATAELKRLHAEEERQAARYRKDNT